MSHRRRRRRTSATRRHHEKRRETFAQYLDKNKKNGKPMNLISLVTCSGSRVTINPAYVVNCYQKYGTGRVVLVLSTGDRHVLAEQESYRGTITKIMNANANNLPF